MGLGRRDSTNLNGAGYQGNSRPRVGLGLGDESVHG